MLKGRSLARAIVLQTLFELDNENAWSKNYDDIMMRNFAEFAGSDALLPFIKTLLHNVISKKSEIDKVIEKAAPQWPLDRIAPIDRNILRIGLAELFFADHAQVPYKVAINEAIELAKKFGSENSSKFVNGVLGTVYKEMGEPGKHDKNDNIQEEDVVAAFCYAKHEGDIYLAMVHDIFGFWTLVKGKKETGESDEDAIKRKVKDEIGVELIRVRDKLGESSYKANNKEGQRVKRNVTYYLVELPFVDLNLKKEGGLDDAKWFKLSDIKDLKLYDDVMDIATKAINILISE